MKTERKLPLLVEEREKRITESKKELERLDHRVTALKLKIQQAADEANKWDKIAEYIARLNQTGSYETIANNLDEYRRLGGKIDDDKIAGSNKLITTSYHTTETDVKGINSSIQRIKFFQQTPGAVSLGTLLRYKTERDLFATPTTKPPKETKKIATPKKTKNIDTSETERDHAGYRPLSG